MQQCGLYFIFIQKKNNLKKYKILYETNEFTWIVFTTENLHLKIIFLFYKNKTETIFFFVFTIKLLIKICKMKKN